MSSTFTPNVGLEKIGTGEQAGSWGATTNVNLDVLDSALNGQLSITTTKVNSNDPLVIDITKASAAEDEDGNNLYIVITSGSDLSANTFVRLETTTVKKICYVKNSLAGSRSLTLYQTTVANFDAAKSVTIANGATALVKFDGGGDANATVTNVFDNEVRTGAFTIDNINLNGNAITATDTDGDVQLVPNGTGEVVIGTGSAAAELTSSGAQDLLLTTDSNTNNSGNITITKGTNGDITIAPNGEGQTNISQAKLTSPFTPIAVKTGNFSLALSEIGAIHTVTSSSEVTLTIPDGGDTFAEYFGASWTIVNTGSSDGKVKLSVPAGNTLTWVTGTGLTTVSGIDSTRKIIVGGIATIFIKASDTYYIIGSGIE